MLTDASVPELLFGTIARRSRGVAIHVRRIKEMDSRGGPRALAGI